MNRKIETLKIKVNSIAEMLSEMRKLKNSGGEWKLLENYSAHSYEVKGEWSENSTRKFIMSNGQKKVELIYDLCTTDPHPTTLLWPEEKKELKKTFPPEETTPFFIRKAQIPNTYFSGKEIKKNNKEWTSILRWFNAWSLDDLRKILVDYYVANKAEIDQFNENNCPHGVADPSVLASQWLEVGEDDQLFYIWVGKRDTEKGYYRGGGEWEICLKKSDLVGKYNESGYKLIECAGSQGVQILKQFLNVHWLALTDVTGSNNGNEHTITYFENHPVGFDPNCCDQNGNLAFPSGGKPNDSQKPNPISGQNSNPSQPSNLSKSAQEQVRHYMEQNGIFQLTLDNGKLVVEYNNSSKKEEKEINSQQLKTIRDYLKGHNNIVNFEQLNSGSNSPTTNSDKKPDYTFWIVGGIGLVLVAGIFIYWIRKRKNK